MKKIGLLGMVLVLCLAALGAGYAMWSETLTIDGTVSTGNVDVDMSVVSYGDDEIAGKDVSDVVATATAEGVNILITDAYPCVTYTVVVRVTSTGTVPVHFESWDLTGTTVPQDAIEVLTDLNAAATQLHQNGYADVTVQIHLTNENLGGDNMGMNSSFDINFALKAVQYNELPY